MTRLGNRLNRKGNVRVKTPAILIASRSETENQILSKKLAPLSEGLPFRLFTGHLQGVSHAVDAHMSLVILNMAEWSEANWTPYQDLRKSGHKEWILVMAKGSFPKQISDLATREAVVFMEKPFESRDFLGLVHKILVSRSVAQRIHRRYHTNQQAELEFSNVNHKIQSKVRNLSKGGAYIEVPAVAPAAVGDVLRLRLSLNQLHKTYMMPARVIWKGRDENGSFGIGVEFCGPIDLETEIVGP